MNIGHFIYEHHGQLEGKRLQFAKVLVGAQQIYGIYV